MWFSLEDAADAIPTFRQDPGLSWRLTGKMRRLIENRWGVLVIQLSVMKSILRLYLNTSRGNDPFLFRQLKALQLKPKYDEHLHSFYFDAPFSLLFHLSFHSFIAENMWVQIGKPFPAVNQLTLAQQLEKMQFKNFLPLKRGLIENMTLNIVVRETQFPLSDRLYTSLLQQALQKEITKREYHQNIVKALGSSINALPYNQIRQIVHRKWEQQDLLIQQKYSHLLTHQPPTEPIKQLPLSQEGQTAISARQGELASFKHIDDAINHQLTSQIAYHPNLTLYVRRNQGRILLKLNRQQMYKHGWKKQVGWGPIRETIVAAILQQTGILDGEGEIKLWDPFCGSGTIALVALANYYSLKVREDIGANFNWPHWSIYKPEYLQEYLRSQEQKNRQRVGRLRIVCSDIGFQAVNYALGNLRELQKSMPELVSAAKVQNLKRLKPHDQIHQVRGGEWTLACGDFEQISKNIFGRGEKVTILTNLPYTNARSKDHIPLNQLSSIYRRFNKMIQKNSSIIANVFVIINNSPEDITSPFHFLKVSTQQWVEITSFESGGMPIGLFGWRGNTIKCSFTDIEVIKAQILKEKAQIQNLPQQNPVGQQLVKYREKLREIQKKNYFLPKHLTRLKRGWRLVVQKRRRRHLLSAYELFAKRRDKMQAFAQYTKNKLQVGMLKRGYIWRKRNMRLLSDINVEQLQKQLKGQFQGRIKDALQRAEERQSYRKMRQQQINKEKEAKEAAKRKMLQQKHEARVMGKLGKTGKAFKPSAEKKPSNPKKGVKRATIPNKTNKRS